MDEGSTTAADGTMLFAGEAWSDPIEAGIHSRTADQISPLPPGPSLIHQDWECLGHPERGGHTDPIPSNALIHQGWE
jgi:hypothetical protein